MRDIIRIITSKRQISCGNLGLSCRIGAAGAVNMEKGREGDSKTPLGKYILRFGFYRADRLPKPPSNLTFHALSPEDGWCDDPQDPAYNRYIRLPYPAEEKQVSHEKLWRDDGAYDIILVMSHNDSPPIAGLGSAVFIHVAQPDDRKTLGCVALAPENMVRLLPKLRMGQIIEISA